MKIKEKIKKVFDLLKATFKEFMADNGIKLSASLSYYTIFSLPPLLIIIISLSGIFFGAEAVKGEIFGQINELVGNEAALQIQEMIKNVKISGDNTLAAVIGAVTLIIGASGVFMEIQDSINSIWGLKAKPRKGFMKLIKNRLISFSMIASIGFLLLVSLIINALMDILSNGLEKIFPDIAVHFFYILNIALVIAIISLLFSIIFKALPDGKVSWKDTLVGALFTSFLFLIGKFAIGAYLGSSNIASTYGSAGSLIVILLWVYYSAIILYFGAAFTKVYSYKYGKKIIPNKYAVYIKKQEIEYEPKIINDES